MGTRSLICIFYKGRFVVAQYCQWDGYPGGQGVDILVFLLEPGNIERLKTGLQYVTVLDTEEIEKINEQNYDQPGVVPASLMPATGAKILDMIANAGPEAHLPIFLDLAFANDSLFCEWAYVVDLDKEVFEVFGGFTSKDQARTKRFADVGGEGGSVPALMESFSFADLPTPERMAKIGE